MSKREREDDRKAVNTLRTKNEHALHEIKKKEGEEDDVDAADGHDKKGLLMTARV